MSQAKVARGLARCPPVSQAKVARGLAWCPRAKPRWHEALHGALPRAKPRWHGALLGAREPSQGGTGPCMVPASQAKVARGLAWCPPASSHSHS
uniref:Uncharacterized protein n=1 Tax=Vitis vinifera TaxID=29760 RepID=A5B950_VITVI|nr:hypothetical protein VITISV_008897 [Vitis vinifera]